MERLTEKIQKLLALASSDFEAEAKAALLKAQALMAEYGISLGEVNAHQARDTFDGVSQSVIDKGSSRIATWQKRLSRIVAENFRCRTFFRSYGNHRRDLLIYGKSDDVEIAKQTVEFALISARNNWQRYKKSREKREGKMPSRAHTEALKNDYMKAFASGVKEAFAKQVREKAIVLVVDPVVTKYADEVLHLGTEARPATTTLRDAHAYSSGYQDGLRIRGGDKLTNSVRQIAARSAD